MSTVKFDTWQTADGTRTLAGASAWVNFNGTGTVTIRDSLNVSSITDNNAGDYTINFATAMANANYAAVGNSADISWGGTLSLRTLTTTSVDVLLTKDDTLTFSNADSSITTIATFGGI